MSVTSLLYHFFFFFACLAIFVWGRVHWAIWVQMSDDVCARTHLKQRIFVTNASSIPWAYGEERGKTYFSRVKGWTKDPPNVWGNFCLKQEPILNIETMPAGTPPTTSNCLWPFFFIYTQGPQWKKNARVRMENSTAVWFHLVSPERVSGFTVPFTLCFPPFP